MLPRFALLLAFLLLLANVTFAQSTAPPLRVAVVGLVHGHVDGFFQHNLHRSDIEIVGISDRSRSLFDKYAKQFNLDPKLYFATLDDMLVKTHPQAVLIYTSTYDHRAVVEAAARRGIHVMMEKPLAVSYVDAEAIAAAATRGKIHVLVNYETTWYRSNHAAYDLVQDGALGGSARSSCTTAIVARRKSASSLSFWNGLPIPSSTVVARSSTSAATAPIFPPGS